MKRLLGSLLVLLSLPCNVEAKEIKLRGYVTQIISPTSFEIEDYRITRDLSLVLEFEKDEEGGNVEFRPEELRVGTLVEIKGDYDDNAGELRAKSIRVILEEFKKIKRTALIEKAPALNKTEGGWEGTFFADGQRIHVATATQVLFKLNRSEKKAKEKKEKKGLVPEADDGGSLPLESVDQIGPNTFMTYEGMRQLDGSVFAQKVEFMRNELDSWEIGVRKKLRPKVKDPNYSQLKAGELKVYRDKYKLLPSQQVQQYIQQLGLQLVPEHQRNLLPDNPDKIDFKFYVVVNKVPNAGAYPNGVIIVHSGMLEIIENEAQLASVLSHEIAHAIQEHSRRQHEYHRKKLMAMKIGAAIGSIWGGRSVMDIANMIENAVKNGYQRALENQADRTALGYMIAAGYDIRQAPYFWKVMAFKIGDAPTNFFYSSHDNHTTRRSYLMAELRMNYPDLDYGQLRTNEEEYRRIAVLAREATDKKQRLKVKY